MEDVITNSKIIRSHIRLFIVGILINPENTKSTISQLHKSINLICKENYDYKGIHKHVKVLEKLGVIKLIKKKKQQGSPVYVALTDIEKYRKMIKSLGAFIDKEFIK
jgi:hypothetical protein